MTKLHLFTAMCEVADALQAECVRLDFSPLKIVLEQIVDRVDVLIDEILEDTTLFAGEEEESVC